MHLVSNCGALSPENRATPCLPPSKVTHPLLGDLLRQLTNFRKHRHQGRSAFDRRNRTASSPTLRRPILRWLELAPTPPKPDIKEYVVTLAGQSLGQRDHDRVQFSQQSPTQPCLPRMVRISSTQLLGIPSWSRCFDNTSRN